MKRAGQRPALSRVPGREGAGFASLVFLLGRSGCFLGGLAFGRLAVEGSTPEIEETISTIMDRATVTIWSTYVLICAVGFVATFASAAGKAT